MTSGRNIILASTSLGRKELLERAGLQFSVEPSDYKEDMSLAVPPLELVKVLSQGKARAVAGRHKNAIVIGADSVAVLGDKVLGKPADDEQAINMLEELSGKTHIFMTGFTIIDIAAGKEVMETAQTKVYFKELTPDEISGYVRSGEPDGHAGAYSIQGKGAMLVERIEGEHTNIIGLPAAKLSSALKLFKVNLLTLGTQEI